MNDHEITIGVMVIPRSKFLFILLKHKILKEHPDDQEFSDLVTKQIAKTKSLLSNIDQPTIVIHKVLGFIAYRLSPNRPVEIGTYDKNAPVDDLIKDLKAASPGLKVVETY